MLRRRKLGRTSCREISRLSKHDIRVVRNDLLAPNPQEPELLIRWGCTSQFPCKKVLNTVEAIREVNDKLEFRKNINRMSLCPQTTFDMHDPNIVYPCVVRPERHAQGRYLFVCHDKEELVRACNHINLKQMKYYISTLINKVAEYRVFVVQGRVACVAKKTPGNPDQVAWNVAQGGRFDNVGWGDWPLKVVKAAIEAFNLTKLDFGGVDVMLDAENRPFILEINSAPSLTSPYRQQCMAKCFDYIIEYGKKRIPLVDKKGDWKKFVHPAVSDRALMA